MNRNPRTAPWEEFARRGVGSDVDRFECGARDGDAAIVQSLRAPGEPDAYVAVYTTSAVRRSTTSAFLSTADARRLAASLLNFADEIDGTTPLVFLPEASR